MKASLFVAATALTVSACCGQLPDLPQVAFGAEGEAASKESEGARERGRKVMSPEEAVGELKNFHEKMVGDAADGLCVEEVAAVFEVMTVKGKGASVKLAVVPPSFGRNRQRAVTAGSTATVTYRNPQCPPAEVGTSGGPTAAPKEAEEEAE